MGLGPAIARLISSRLEPSARSRRSAIAPKVACWLTCAPSTIESPSKPIRKVPAGFARSRSTSRRPSEFSCRRARCSVVQMPRPPGVDSKPKSLSGWPRMGCTTGSIRHSGVASINRSPKSTTSNASIPPKRKRTKRETLGDKGEKGMAASLEPKIDEWVHIGHGDQDQQQRDARQEASTDRPLGSAHDEKNARLLQTKLDPMQCE